VLILIIDLIDLIVSSILYLTYKNHQDIKAENKNQIKEKSSYNESENIKTEKQYQLDDINFIINSFSIAKDQLENIASEDKIGFNFPHDNKLRIAVADGASESIYSGIWAETIVNKYLEYGASLLNQENLEDLQEQFLTHAYQCIEEAPDTRQWFLYEKLERGTGATLIALEFSSSRTVDILSVGDSCLFWKENYSSEQIEMFPELSVQDFGNLPGSICHLSQSWNHLNQCIQQKRLTYTNQFQALICSDAFACWLVRELETNPSIWDDFFKFEQEQSNFQEFISDLRNKNKIRNDDVAVVTINAVPTVI